MYENRFSAATLHSKLFPKVVEGWPWDGGISKSSTNSQHLSGVVEVNFFFEGDGFLHIV